VRFHPPLSFSVTFSIFTVSAFIFLTLTVNIPIFFTAIPQHIVSLIHCTGYSTLLNTLHCHSWWDALPCCYDPHLLNNVNVLVYKLMWTHEDSQFSPQLVLVVLRIIKTRVLDVVCDLISMNSWLFLWFLHMFAKLQKPSIILAMSVHMELLAPTGWIFMNFDIWIFVNNLLRKCKFH